MNDDLIAQAVFDYLENGGELPSDASKNPQTRFKFQTAIARHSFAKSCEAKSLANDAMEKVEAVEGRLKTFKAVILTKFDALKDKVDVRLGIVGGIIVVAQAIMYFALR